ncbi:hypothetical protein [Erythrobacter sp.]|uniref:hypothetical protein n=1 Tax=Erythrobacter sp. TaxID=1042 RepID=UPI002EADC886|nr:hypothetical protein [Erythrobacter sp.]
MGLLLAGCEASEGAAIRDAAPETPSVTPANSDRPYFSDVGQMLEIAPTPE